MRTLPSSCSGWVCAVQNNSKNHGLIIIVCGRVRTSATVAAAVPLQSRGGGGFGVNSIVATATLCLLLMLLPLPAPQVTCTLTDGRKFLAEVKGSDTLSDLAVLQIDRDVGSDQTPLPEVTLGDSQDLQVRW